MKKMMILLFAMANSVHAQTPGGIAGTVSDADRGRIPGVEVSAQNVETGRSVPPVITNETGGYVLLLEAGEYRVSVAFKGFQSVTRHVTVRTGIVLTEDFSLTLAQTEVSIDVQGDPPQMHYDSPTVGGSITRRQFEEIPINGRTWQDLARQTPGVQAAVNLPGRVVVPSLGAPGGRSGRGTLQMIDKGSVMSVSLSLLGGGSPMKFSQEALQEFQMSTANFDLSTPSTVSGVMNAETRRGGDDYHGEGFWYFRDHNLAAYPALFRDGADLDPFFQRRQYGLAVSGPIRPRRAYFFAIWERNEQRGVGTTTLNDPDFAHLSRITATSSFGNLLSVRVDGNLSNNMRVFARYSHDGNRNFAPHPERLNHYPSSWFPLEGWTDQSLLGVTSYFPGGLNDFRFSYFFHSSKQLPLGEEDCSGCVGLGAPSIEIGQAGLTLGLSTQSFVGGRRFQVNDSVMKMSGKHRLHFGGNWEHNRDNGWSLANEPARIFLFSPSQARRAGITIPETFQTVEDILALPLNRFTVSVGEPRVPQADGGLVRNWDTMLLFFQDTWQLSPGVTVNYGLGWSIDRNLNYDLSKPRLLAPILGENGLGPTKKDWKNFSPALGLTWSPSSDRKTTVRFGAGLFYDFLFQAGLESERVALGPPRLGRQLSQGNSIPNPLDVDTRLFFQSPTLFRGADLMSALGEIRDGLLQSSQNTNRSFQQIEVTKTGVGLNRSEVPRTSALHVNAGIRRQLAKDFVVNADVVFKRFNHLGLGQIDANHYDSKAAGSAIPKCVSLEERNDPQALCSAGQITFLTPAGRADYRGLLVGVNKGFFNGSQLLASWAYSRITGTLGRDSNGFNLLRWHENRGPFDTDFTHILNLSGMTRLPSRFTVGFNFSYSSAPPFSAYVGGIDFNGDGTPDDLLPGSTVNAFNRGKGPKDLEQLVSQFNSTKAGQLDAANTAIPMLTLPAQYSFGDNFQALDLRLSRSFSPKDGMTLKLMVDVFNVYNAANLSGHSGDLTNKATFGQPTNRYSQVFGSGGPRAFQLGAKLSF